MRKIKIGITAFIAATVAVFAACDLVTWNDPHTYISSGSNPGIWTSISTNYLGQVRVQAGYTGSEEKVLLCKFKVKNCFGLWDVWDDYTVTNRSWTVDSGWWWPNDVEEQGISSYCRIQNSITGTANYEYKH